MRGHHHLQHGTRSGGAATGARPTLDGWAQAQVDLRLRACWSNVLGDKNFIDLIGEEVWRINQAKAPLQHLKHLSEFIEAFVAFDRA